jgi:hypothetical protein
LNRSPKTVNPVFHFFNLYEGGTVVVAAVYDLIIQIIEHRTRFSDHWKN